MGFTIYIKRIRLEFALGWLYIKFKISVAPRKKRH